MPHSIWSGTISFGLVAIPVSLVVAVRRNRTVSHYLHRGDFARLKREMVCPAHGKVQPEEIVRGYQAVTGKYIAVTDEELEALEPKRSRTIEITEFVPAGELKPSYFDTPYYLVPTNAEKAYSLLTSALAETGRVGIARFVLRNRERLVAIESIDNALCLVTLYFGDEIIRNENEEAVIRNDLTEKYEKLTDEMVGDFQLAEVVDEKELALARWVSEKIAAGEVVSAGKAQAGVGEDSELESAEGDENEFLEALRGSIARAKPEGRVDAEKTGQNRR